MTGEEFDNVRWHKGMRAKIFIEGMGTVIGVRFDKSLVIVRLDKEPINRREFPATLVTLGEDKNV